MRLKIFYRYPWLFFVLAAVVISNSIFKYAPGQALGSPQCFIVPAIFVAIGASFYIGRGKEKNAD